MLHPSASHTLTTKEKRAICNVCVGSDSPQDSHQTYKIWSLLGFDCRKLSDSNRKGYSCEKGKVALKARQIVTVTSRPLGGAHAGLFIGDVKGLFTMPSLPSTTYPANRVHGQGGNLIYYIKTPLYNASNKMLTCAGDDTAAFG
jgi:hypothetical protein